MSGESTEERLCRLEASGLRGRGGGWFETHRKWRAVLAEERTPLVVANGGEGEPGSIKDRFVMRTRPADVLAGLDLAISTLGAERGYVYLKGSFTEEEGRLRDALASMDRAHRITIHRGDDTYVGGEETALLESIEGRKGWPRPKPPRPASIGLFGWPTLVQNVDTLARVAAAIQGGREFPATDTLTVTVWGDVRSPGAFEVAPGRTLRSVIDSEGGGPSSDVGLVFPNGAHSMPLVEDELDTALSPTALAARGSSLGVASILVLNREASAASIVESVSRFFERESCGQCPPCALGATNLRRLVTGDRPPTLRLTPHAALSETATFMSMHGYCSHSRAGASAVTGLFRRFEAPIMESLRHGGERAQGTRRDPYAPGSAERAALDTFLSRH